MHVGTKEQDVLLVGLNMANLSAIGTFPMSASRGILRSRPRGCARRGCIRYDFISAISANNALLLFASLSTFFIPFKSAELLLQASWVLVGAMYLFSKQCSLHFLMSLVDFALASGSNQVIKPHRVSTL